MSRNKRRISMEGINPALSVLGALVMLVFVLAGPASAGCDEGDAQAISRAFLGGGLAVRFIASNVAEDQASPQDLVGPCVIRAATPFDGLHFCADDWHVIDASMYAFGPTRTFHHRDAKSILDATPVSFTLDGQPLTTTRTAITAANVPAGLPSGSIAFGVSDTRIMSPSDLAVGAHTLTLVTGGSDPFTATITFFIDPSGSGSCSN